MTRSRTPASARQAGARFEAAVAAHLAEHVDPRIERRANAGKNDRGDVAGVHHQGHRLVVECKDHRALDLATWAKQAEVARQRDDALAALVVHKRQGRADIGDQWVTMPVRDLVALLNGERPADGTVTR